MHLKTFEDMQKTSAFFMLKPANAIYGFIITLCISIIAILIWASFAPMDDVVKGTVLLRPNEAVSSIKCVTSGELAEKYFENDEIVEKGDLLFCLDTTSYKSQLKSYIKEQNKNINDISTNNEVLNTIETNKLPKLPITSDAFIKCSAYISEYKRYESGIKDIKTKLEREQNKPESLKIPQIIQDLKSDLYQNELAFETWKNNQKMQALETEKQLESTKNSLENRISELERIIKNSTLYAPISGRISEISKLNIGDYILAGEEILKIIPQNNEKLKAEIYVDPNYVARIKTKDPVKIRFPGLPPSQYGMIETEISIIPPDVTYVNGQPVFIAEAEIENPYLIAKNGQTAKLIPGITAEGRIITDKSTVMQMVLRKLDFMN